MSDLVKKWSASGLLDGMNQEDKIIFSQYCENAASFMVESKCFLNLSTTKSTPIEIFLFPIICRIFRRKTKKELNYADLCYDFFHESGLFYDYEEDIYEKIKSDISSRYYSSIDLEADLCLCYSSDFKSLNKRKILIESLSVIRAQKKKELFKKYGIKEQKSN